MKKIILATILIVISTETYAADPCENSSSFGRRIYLQKELGMTFERYRSIEGEPPLMVLDKIERRIFLKKVSSEDEAAFLSNAICNMDIRSGR